MRMLDKYVELINRMLEQASSKRNFASQTARLLYQQGYLVGLLASLAYQDSSVLVKLRHKYEKDGGSARN